MSSDADAIQRIKEAEERSRMDIESARKEMEMKLKQLSERHRSDLEDLRERLEKEHQRSLTILTAKTREYRERVTKAAREKAASMNLKISDREIRKIVSDLITKSIGE